VDTIPVLPTNPRHGFDVIAAAANGMGMRTLPFLSVHGFPYLSGLRDAQPGARRSLLPAYPLTTLHRALLADAAIRQKLPAIAEFAEFATIGGLASHGPDWVTLFRNRRRMWTESCGGAKPGELPIEQPTHYELTLNEKTASTLGIRFPPVLKLSADRVIS
jgi:putative ABC transport system substrate-binding protein